MLSDSPAACRIAQPFPFRVAGRLPTRGDPRLFRGSALQSFSRAGEVPMRNDLSRRKFLERVGLTTAGVGLSLFPEVVEAHPTIASLPKRTLGRTNAKVSILAFGCGSRFLMYEDEEKALAALNRALDLGITYLDTAYAYGDGKSETRVGKLMATRRKEVFLATKIPDRKHDDFLRRLEGSLKRLQVDQVDLVHIHSLRLE